ncbi:cytochrome b5 domain-containing protein [Haloimpatiens sp. FM7330]|uniref:cytochrome b5 domain-containing protein n=1 Tax=Haloimpatiens sp. FM7330 TaxID=3298610 RepID=UPI00362F23CE
MKKKAKTEEPKLKEEIPSKKETEDEKQIAPKERTEIDEKNKNEVPLKEFTKAEVAQYNGKNGKPMYAIVNKIVYDVSDMPQWKNGKHYGHNAGRDFTSEMNRSPHGLKVLEDAKVVGKVID